MPKLTSQQLKEKYQNLPQDLRDAIFSVDSANVIRQTGGKYNLMIDKIGELADETGMVMLGATHPKEFIPNLENRLGVSKATARKIAEEINSQIFAKVRESLKKVHGMGETKTAVPPPSAPAAMASPGAFRSPSLPSESAPTAPVLPEKEDKKKEILKEIEKDETVKEREENVSGDVSDSPPPPKSPFEAKMAEGVLRMPSEESKHREETEPKTDAKESYPKEDPYREPIE